MSNLNPIGNNVIVEIISQLDAEAIEVKARLKKMGLVHQRKKDIAKDIQGPPRVGIVYAMGPDAVKQFDSNIIKGDKVFFIELNPKGFHWDGKPLLSISADQIIARMERKKK